MAVPAIKNDEVLIKVKQVGNYTPSRPFVLGHEFSGDVVKVGSEVKNFKENDRVAVDPSMNCGTCEYCQSDRSNLCSNMKYLGSAMYVPPVDGAENVNAPGFPGNGKWKIKYEKFNRMP